MFHGEIHGPLWGRGRVCREQGIESIPSELTYITKAAGEFLDNFFPFLTQHLHKGSAITSRERKH